MVSKSYGGKIFFAEDFAEFGSADNIRQILFRLEQGERITHGIYLKHRKDSLLGTFYSTTEEVAKEIARRGKARLLLQVYFLCIN